MMKKIIRIENIPDNISKPKTFKVGSTDVPVAYYNGGELVHMLPEATMIRVQEAHAIALAEFRDTFLGRVEFSNVFRYLLVSSLAAIVLLSALMLVGQIVPIIVRDAASWFMIAVIAFWVAVEYATDHYKSKRVKRSVLEALKGEAKTV